MSHIVMRVENLGKLYRIGAPERYKALRDTITEAFTKPFRRLRTLISENGASLPDSSENTFWALKNVSFKVKRGEVIGIIGRNGAGKSTLLKILSRITEPTEGFAEIRGRVGSLLEVGTGFHPELTGRENIFLNGAILGMRKAEINRKFDAIVAFAEVEKFIDTPVKHYSSGMYVRLAFAVAAHLEPEILLVDEVLAVGDAEFQKKCLGKMGQVAQEGRTVLFVSHQMNAIRKLCEKCIWLDCGQIKMFGPKVEVVSAYGIASTSPSLNDMARNDDKNTHARFIKWEIVESDEYQPNFISTLGPVSFRFILRANKAITNGHHGVALYDAEQRLLWATAVDGLNIESGLYGLSFAIPTIPIRPGIYYFQVSIWNEGKLLDYWNCTPELIVITEPVTHPRDEWTGILNIPSQFSITNVS